MSFRVQLTRRAERDVDFILNYLEQRSRYGASAWANRFESILRQLANAALSASLAPENEDHDEEIRHVTFEREKVSDIERSSSYALIGFS